MLALYLNVGDANARHQAAMTLRPPVLLAALLLEDAHFLGLVLIVDDADHACAVHEGRARLHIARISAHQQDLIERDLSASLAGVVSVDGNDGARLHAKLPS